MKQQEPETFEQAMANLNEAMKDLAEALGIYKVLDWILKKLDRKIK